MHHHVNDLDGRSARPCPLVANGRIATAKYATSLARAKRDGYTVIVTRQIPDMGWHFMNPAYTKFDVKKPPILVYDKRGANWQLVAFEWVFPEKPAKPPLPGATYGSFAAACHYKDGTFVPATSQDDCATEEPGVGSAVRLLAPGLRDVAPVALVPESGRHLRGDEPADQVPSTRASRRGRTEAQDSGLDPGRMLSGAARAAPLRLGSARWAPS